MQHTTEKKDAKVRPEPGEEGESGFRVEKTVIVNRPVQEVYGFWRNFENLPRIMKHLKSVQKVNQRRSHWVTSGPFNSSVEWDADIITDEPNHRITWRSVHGAEVENAGSVVFRPLAATMATEVHVEMAYHPPAGKLGDCVAKIFGKDPAKQISEDMEQFKSVMETQKSAMM